MPGAAGVATTLGFIPPVSPPPVVPAAPATTAARVRPPSGDQRPCHHSGRAPHHASTGAGDHHHDPAHARGAAPAHHQASHHLDDDQGALISSLAHHAAAVAAAAGFGLPVAAGPPEVRCLLADQRIAESSGVAASSRTDDVVFTHNDSGDSARFFAVDTRTCATRATYSVRGAKNVDWEDMAGGAAPDGTPVLWLADIGDNGAKRSGVVVYEVAEPGPGVDGPLPVRSRWTLTYPDGAHDAETLLVDPETGRPAIVTKESARGASRAYRVPRSGSGVLEPLAGLDVRSLPGGGFAGPSWSLTAGATSPDRRRLVLRSYLAAWTWTTAPGEPLATSLARPPERLDLPVGRQSEAVSFTRDGSAVWTTSEGAGSPLTLVPLSSPSPTPAAGGASPSTPSPADPILPVGIRTRPLLLLAGAGTALVVGLLLLVFRVSRRRP